MQRHSSVVLLFAVVLFLLLAPLSACSAGQASQCQLTVFASTGGTTAPAPGSYEYAFGTNLTVTAQPNPSYSSAHWILDGQNINQNPISLQMTQDHTLQPVFTNNKGNNGNGNSGQGGMNLNFNPNIPPELIMAVAAVIIVLCAIRYLAPLGWAIGKGKIPPGARKPSLILALVSILIIAGPLGGIMLTYRSDLNGMFIPSNLTNLTNGVSTQGGIINVNPGSSGNGTSNQGGVNDFNVTNLSYNLTSHTLILTFNFTNPFATNFTLKTLTADIAEHNDGYPLGQISLPNPVTAAPNETLTVTFTAVLDDLAAAHVAATNAGATHLTVDVSNPTINVGGIILQKQGTIGTADNVQIVR